MVLPVVIQVKNGPGNHNNTNNYLFIVDLDTGSTIKSATLVLMDGSGLTWRVPTGCDEDVSLYEPPAMRRCRHRSDKTRLMKKVSVSDCLAAALYCGCCDYSQCHCCCSCADFVVPIFIWKLTCTAHGNRKR